MNFIITHAATSCRACGRAAPTTRTIQMTAQLTTHSSVRYYVWHVYAYYKALRSVVWSSVARELVRSVCLAVHKLRNLQPAKWKQLRVPLGYSGRARSTSSAATRRNVVRATRNSCSSTEDTPAISAATSATTPSTAVERYGSPASSCAEESAENATPTAKSLAAC